MDEAEKAYRKALQLKPDQETAWDFLVRLYCRTNRATRIEAELRQKLEPSPDAVGMRTALAYALLQQKKLVADVKRLAAEDSKKSWNELFMETMNKSVPGLID